jgi:uncharacterized protein (TIGR02680 family)
VTATVEHLPSAPGLPRPVPGRMRPLRAGIRNVWEYDDQEFWFADGRLILRGQNTAGKSKALELLLPLVLDGDIRSERLDPFGSKAKTMYWNLIDFADRPSAIGYCWVEFGRTDELGTEQFTTCIVGMRAVRSAGKKVDTWFAVTPARVGADLELAPGGVPLTAEQFRAALPERSVPSAAVRDHRAAVDHALFGLGPERYGALIHLLLQLRRPKLSEKLDMTRLGEYLTDALPPLEHQRMESLALAFARLDEDSNEIERLEASAAQLHSFLVAYCAHAAVQTRLRADAVRGATTRLDKVTETERVQRAEFDRAKLDLEAIEVGRRETAADIRQTRGQLQGLDLSKVHALQEVERRADEAEGRAKTQSIDAERDRERAEQARDEATEAGGAATRVEIERDEQVGRVVEIADRAGVGDEHRLQQAQLLGEPERGRVAMDGAADRREATLRAVQQAAEEAERSREQIAHAEERHREAEAAVEDAEERERLLIASRDEAALALAVEIWRWVVEWGIAVADDHTESLVAEVLAGGRPSASPLLSGARAETEGRRRALTAETTRIGDRRHEADSERQRVEAEADAAPPARPGRPALRPAGHVPLWECVDFASGLTGAEQAGLEAALEAAGLLDALVGPGGVLVDPDTLDTWISVGNGSEGPMLAGLVPSAAGAMDEEVSHALAGIVRSGATVSTDGRWSMGSLQGRWSKDAPQYIGAAARAEARRRRLESLAEEIRLLDNALAELAEEDSVLNAELERLELAEAAWPPTDWLHDACRDAEQAADGTERARRELSDRSTTLDEARAKGRGAFEGLRRAEAAAGCAQRAVEKTLSALTAYRVALADAANAARRALEARAAAGDSSARAADAESTAATSAGRSRDAAAAAIEARGEADELRMTAGADADAVLARHRELSAALHELEAARDALEEQRDVLHERRTTASTRLETTEEERSGGERERADALAALARLASTELAVLALGPVDADRDLTQITAGLSFARSAYERLREVATDQPALDAASNRFHNGVTVLRSQLGTDFDPYLDTSEGIEVCYATLNGAVVGVSELSNALDEQVRRRRETLSAEERDLIERHLLTEVGTHLGERVHAAWSLVHRMNEQLEAHPTRSGTSLRLSWEARAEAGPGAEQAIRLLRKEVALLDQPERATLAAFLAEQVRTAREEGEGADAVERLAAALDYRHWHRFVVHRRTGGHEARLTARTQSVGSGGEQAKLAHLPLFAATAAYYSSARPNAPHPLMLDEAFAGIDDNQRGDCMGMLVDLDLDMVLTNYAEWGCYPEVPAVATYHLERTPGRYGVTALRFVWNGEVREEDDPWLDAKVGLSLAEQPNGDSAGRNGDGLFA